ncbi:MAG: phospholipase [Xanthomonadales bacterium]|nr:phospholipase [Gammaproteobacteria bacterium]MBT8050068.1 phospholipase [Gammaproteobacteria bacterium]NNJ78929.1 phospholipase [Xanthomonadales bacterium]NNL04758.1 phospholipase [Xanthomonadales bacterium]
MEPREINRFNRIHWLAWILAAGCLASCATTPPAPSCPAGTQELPGCPPIGAIEDAELNELYDDRTWLAPAELDVDLVELGKNAQIPVQFARVKFLGPSQESALDSLAAKLWMIENAEHTIDFSYYIFKTDLVGYAMVGALCKAVQRGVDIRVTVDAAGSISGLTQPTLRALETCADDAGFMRNADGQLTTKKARVQVVVFNAITRLGNINRRSHDKLLVKDGHFEEKSAVMTGGRNISTDYYAIDKEGRLDPNAYRDAELLIRSPTGVAEEDITVGELSEAYATVLFLMDNNKRIRPRSQSTNRYERERLKAQSSLRELKASETLGPHWLKMDAFMTTGFFDSKVRLAHELGNLTDRKVVSEAMENEARNPNSIMSLLGRLGDEDPDIRSVRIVSPYIFLARFTDKQDNVILDEAAEFRTWLDEHPEARLEIVTNSVLTSDNFSAQSIIDMETAPRLLLPPAMREQWLKLKSANEMESELVNDGAWAEIINDPRVRVYETGRLDSIALGQGDKHYGKLHAKFLLTGDVGFVGTTNFDYRSRLYNNEMGFFFHDDELAAEIHRSFDDLVASSYLWGSPEWFELRKAVMDNGGIKGSSTRKQRGLYRFFNHTGVIWLL